MSNNVNKEFNKKIAMTVDEHEEYIMMETFFIDSAKYGRLYDALQDSFRIFWIPRSYKDRLIQEELITKRAEYFGKDHVRSTHATIGDLLLYLATEAKKQCPGTKKEDHLDIMFKSLEFYTKNKDIFNRRNVGKLLCSNNYYIENSKGKTLYSMFGFPREREDNRLIVASALKQYIFLRSKGYYDKDWM